MRTFGLVEAGVDYTLRRAAYAVVLNEKVEVALVRSRESYFLPGGGALAGEAPEETIAREVCEELGRKLRSLRELGRAVQYFYSATDARHYRMEAVFFTGQFTDEEGEGEHELLWKEAVEAERACFHACHAWAIKEAATAASS